MNGKVLIVHVWREGQQRFNNTMTPGSFSVVSIRNGINTKIGFRMCGRFKWSLFMFSVSLALCVLMELNDLQFQRRPPRGMSLFPVELFCRTTSEEEVSRHLGSSANIIIDWSEFVTCLAVLQQRYRVYTQLSFRFHVSDYHCKVYLTSGRFI